MVWYGVSCHEANSIQWNNKKNQYKAPKLSVKILGFRAFTPQNEILIAHYNSGGFFSYVYIYKKFLTVLYICFTMFFL